MPFPDVSLQSVSIRAVAEDRPANSGGDERGLGAVMMPLQPKEIPAFYTEVKAVAGAPAGPVWIGTSGGGGPVVSRTGN